MKLEYKECAECAAKPGSPPLCAACLHNRTMIDRLQANRPEPRSLVELKANTQSESLQILFDAVAVLREERNACSDPGIADSRIDWDLMQLLRIFREFGPGDQGTKDACAFCGKSRREVKKLIASPRVRICNECLGLCNDIIAANEAGDCGCTAPCTC